MLDEEAFEQLKGTMIQSRGEEIGRLQAEIIQEKKIVKGRVLLRYNYLTLSGDISLAPKTPSIHLCLAV